MRWVQEWIICQENRRKKPNFILCLREQHEPVPDGAALPQNNTSRSRYPAELPGRRTALSRYRLSRAVIQHEHATKTSWRAPSATLLYIVLRCVSSLCLEFLQKILVLLPTCGSRKIFGRVPSCVNRENRKILHKKSKKYLTSAWRCANVLSGDQKQLIRRRLLLGTRPVPQWMRQLPV